MIEKTLFPNSLYFGALWVHLGPFGPPRSPPPRGAAWAVDGWLGEDGEGGGPNGPKWTQSAPKYTFSLLEPKMQKGAHFPLLGPKVRKSAHFRTLTPKSLNSDAETICFISIYDQGAKMTPKFILGPKMHFGLQNAFLGPKMHFWVLFAPWPQMLMKPMVSASDFTHFGVKMRK